MKIALVGYGKMGQIIDQIAQSRGHEVVARLNETPNGENLNQPDGTENSCGLWNNRLVR